MSALRHDLTDDGDEETLEDVVARIQASGEGYALPRPPQEAVDQFIARAMAEPPLSQEEQAEWDRRWDAVMDEIYKRDREDDIAEGRG